MCLHPFHSFVHTCRNQSPEQHILTDADAHACIEDPVQFPTVHLKEHDVIPLESTSPFHITSAVALTSDCWPPSLEKEVNVPSRLNTVMLRTHVHDVLINSMFLTTRTDKKSCTPLERTQS